MGLLLAFGLPEQWVLALAAVAVYIVGVPLSTWAEDLWGTEDPGRVCIDEVAGYLVTVLWLPAASEFWTLIAAFFVFRFFDIVKPPPGRRSERLPGGWGVMTDDVVAGVYANLVMQIVVRQGWLDLLPTL